MIQSADTSPNPTDGRGDPAPSAGSRAEPPEIPEIPDRIACPICQTAFEPYAAGGRCPVCGEQVVPEDAVTREVPILTPVVRWLKQGGWRLVLLTLLILFQLVLLIGLWHQFAVAHLL